MVSVAADSLQLGRACIFKDLPYVFKEIGKQLAPFGLHAGIGAVQHKSLILT